MGIPTLIKTLTAADDASLAFVDGAASVVFDGTYDEYMFVVTDIHPETDNQYFSFQCSTDGGSNYNTTITSSTFYSVHSEGGISAFAYDPTPDKAQATTYQHLDRETGADNDQSCAGILHLFGPASTTYVKQFYSRFHTYQANDYSGTLFVGGYFNTTSALDAISFKQTSGNFSGVVQMYGVA